MWRGLWEAESSRSIERKNISGTASRERGKSEALVLAPEFEVEKEIGLGSARRIQRMLKGLAVSKEGYGEGILY